MALASYKPMAAFGEIRDPLIGTRIDERYLVQGVIGRGGMGVVYEGVHEQLGRPVAIKVLGAGIAGDPVAVQRFLREARTASQLTHGNIVDVSDLGQLPDGRPYLVMARMHGTDLAKLLQTEGPQTPKRTAELLRGAAAALDLIHAKGYVHRDVKPENLMHIVREDGSEATLLLDFGIVGLASSAAARLTAEGSVFGTPAYLPPEVIEGEIPDHRADVYALATVAFELITGRTPFFAPNPIQILPQKVMKEPPSMAKVTGYAFPEDLEEALARGLARNPRNRHASAGAFVAALEAASNKHPTAGARSLPPLAADGGGLDPASRDRLLNTSTADLEMPIGTSVPPGANDTTQKLSSKSPAAERKAQLPTLQLPLPGRRKPLVPIVVACAVLLGLVGWLMSRDDPPAQIKASTLPNATNAGPSQPKLDLGTDEPVAATEPSTPAPIDPPPTAAVVPGPSSALAGRTKRATPRAASPEQPKATTAPNATELGQAAQRELIQGHLAAAADLYAKATRVDPSNEPAWRGLGLAYERLGRTADAIKALRRAIQLAPNGQNANMLRTRLQKLGSAP
jgi:serine/threonine protein kinase